MKRRNPEYLRPAQAEELSLSGSALPELLQAVVQKKIPCRFRATGFSMGPFIRDGDILTVAPVATTSLKTGDVVAFTHPVSGRLTVHRIVAEDKSFYRVKGDGLEAADGVIPNEQVIGVIRKVERNGRIIAFGFGPERLLLARLSDSGLLFRVLSPLRRLYRCLRGFC